MKRRLGDVMDFAMRTVHIWGVICMATTMSYIVGCSLTAAMASMLSVILCIEVAEDVRAVRVRDGAVQQWVTPNNNAVVVRVNGADTCVSVGMDTQGTSDDGASLDHLNAVCSVRGDTSRALVTGLARCLPSTVLRTPFSRVVATLESDEGKVVMSKLKAPLRIDALGMDTRTLAYVSHAEGSDDAVKPQLDIPLSLWAGKCGLHFARGAAGVSCDLVTDDQVAKKIRHTSQAAAYIVHSRDTLDPSFVLQSEGNLYLVASNDEGLRWVNAASPGSLPELPGGLEVHLTRKEAASRQSPLEVLEASYVVSDDDRLRMQGATSLCTVTLKEGASMALLGDAESLRAVVGVTRKGSLSRAMLVLKIGLSGAACAVCTATALAW